MTISSKELEKIIQLASLNNETDNTKQLAREVNDIMDLIDRLRDVDTTNAAPLFHPFSVHPRLRADIVTEQNCQNELESLAPLFQDDLYLVPQVIEGK